ncbi:unnamed protein product [Tilletia laevis]|uniref:Uncharacterized protein n=3 Tax=Tilletia TaxID=13289 RepID=A0A8X7MU55_9BASI|nr:hypothetical protein CF336_g4354 [Tilletia laevis]KAE8195309.1 hypothetical protein CF328_g4482 [Tilletia controversa]CAD6887411.1 unnamed protein product [Tilletia caries]KAE8199804.1 hypothetical protein CF335_g4088 [Tilletia laevis]KAE8248536.1 hypothetical protein A4X06_0g3643 [Tilletia controversa]
MDTVPLGPISIALGWQTVKAHRHRLILWRTAVIHYIATLRRPALARHREGGLLHLSIPSATTTASRVADLVAQGILESWRRIQNRPDTAKTPNGPAFDALWASPFVHRSTQTGPTNTLSFRSFTSS